ncbi:hypothetical protein [Alicyclobacillus acidiphilus]|uniref:hypothetical protein n=1 Tax=Alicyclobacillus acidiphilus TaxID=182455 RepID=UPI0012EDBE2A|nr:hypothetical protein [Alicyclobacillus acidiphilus]
MKKSIAIALVVGAVQVVGTVTAMAATSTGYDSSDDTTVNIGSSGQTSQTALSTATFDLQESLYQATGADVSHDYIWVSVNGNSLIALDPPRPMA